MGRSVIPHPHATVVAYDTFLDGTVDCWDCDGVGTLEEDAITCDTCHGEGEVPEEDETGDAWRAFLDWISQRARELWPSFEDADDYLHRSEQSIIARNSHSEISVSEYCGSVAISLSASFDTKSYYADPSEFAGLGEHWRTQISEKFLSEFSTMTKLGSFSDGTSVYQKRSA